jgi:hypothetical protein
VKIAGFAGRLSNRIRPTHRTSISDAGPYRSFCRRAAEDDAAFAAFRRNPVYTEVLEHTTVEQGAAYLSIINRDNPTLLAQHGARFLSGEHIGGPRLQFYAEAGMIAPSTLRYVKVLSDLQRLFGDLSGRRVVEIGVGYGGQCKIVSDVFRLASYSLVDLPEPLALAHRYLAGLQVPNVEYVTMDELGPELDGWDLLISNYSFSELSRGIQDRYRELIVDRALEGYLTCNFTGALYGVDSYSAEELLGMRPGAFTQAEEPLTFEGNKIVVWRRQ